MDEKPRLPRRELSPGNSPSESYFKRLHAAASDEKITHEDEAQLDHIVGQWVDYYNKIRSHIEREHLPPIRDVPDVVAKLDGDQIIVQSHVGGLVKSFERRAA